ncbi:hypothetical protein Pcinc_001655 [Petrolisthes cinctipes]|uniref:Histone-lysine N-methyltransferase EHMT2 n=1 Tax=Petrolisthes cinctipes TaxID=88211 RepID=A0AAE1L4C7_PETCI|nr:hypothetical protein Pcinc_001655 [Petrolisthes cinctipes]
MSSQDIRGKGTPGKFLSGSQVGTSKPSVNTGRRRRRVARWYKNKQRKAERYKAAKEAAESAKAPPAKNIGEVNTNRSVTKGGSQTELKEGNEVSVEGHSSCQNTVTSDVQQYEDASTDRENLSEVDSQWSEEEEESSKDKWVDIETTDQDTMDSQDGDQKSKILRMMSLEFNSATIPEGSVPLTNKRVVRSPRLARKRKSEVLDQTTENAPRASISTPTPPSPSSLLLTSSINPITSALKKVRKESMESSSPVPSPMASTCRTRRSTQERKLGSEKDASKETVTENPDAEAKVDETPATLVKTRSTHSEAKIEDVQSTLGKTRAKARGRLLMEGEEGNDSGTESPVPVVTPKGRSKSRLSSEEDSQAGTTTIDQGSASKGRGKGKGPVESKSVTPVLRGKGKGKGGIVKEETPIEVRGRGKRNDVEKIEEVNNESLTVGKVRGKGKVQCEDPVSIPLNTSTNVLSLRSRVKMDADKDEVTETDTIVQQKGGLESVGRQSEDSENFEDQGIDTVNPSKNRGGKGKVESEEITNTIVGPSPSNPLTRRARGKIEADTEANSETESNSQQRRSMTPVTGDSSLSSEPKRSQRISLARDVPTSQDTTSVSVSPSVSAITITNTSTTASTDKKGKQKPGSEDIKKQDSAALKRKEDWYLGYTKTGKKKKKHYRGLRYSFSKRKKYANKRKSKSSLEGSQETDSIMSEEIDMESIDSSSQDVPSEQMSVQDLDVGEEALSEMADNDDAEMENVETSDANEEMGDVSVAESLTEAESLTTGKKTKEIQDVDDNIAVDKVKDEVEAVNILKTPLNDDKISNKVNICKDDKQSIKEEKASSDDEVEKENAKINTSPGKAPVAVNVQEDLMLEPLPEKCDEANTSSLDANASEKITSPKQNMTVGNLSGEEETLKMPQSIKKKVILEEASTQVKRTITAARKSTGGSMVAIPCVYQEEEPQEDDVDVGDSGTDPQSSSIMPPNPTEATLEGLDVHSQPLHNTLHYEQPVVSSEHPSSLTCKQPQSSPTSELSSANLESSVLSCFHKTEKTDSEPIAADAQLVTENNTQLTIAKETALKGKVDSQPTVSEDAQPLPSSEEIHSARTSKSQSSLKIREDRILKDDVKTDHNRKQSSLVVPQNLNTTVTANTIPSRRSEGTLSHHKHDTRFERRQSMSHDSLYKTDNPSYLAPITSETGLRSSMRRRQSITKRKLDDLSFEGHNSDSSDSLSDARPPGEGVRKSKRLSRHASPRPLAIAAPHSPEGPGRGQAKPIGTPSANVTPASPGEHQSYILSSPVNLTHTCHQEGILSSAAPTLTNVLCKCRHNENAVAVDIAGDIYCQAVDSFDGRMIGCCNVVANHKYYRVSGKIPFMLLCDIHRRRLRRHNCCPCCGLFCTQGVFYECAWDQVGVRHYYHKLCALLLNGAALCPHCGAGEGSREVHLEMKLSRKPVIYLKQHQERKESSARMTWTKQRDTPEGEENMEQETLPEDEPTLELKCGRVISAHKLPLSSHRERLHEAILTINQGKNPNSKPSAKSVYWACKQNDLEKLLHVLVNGLSPNVKAKEYGNQTGLHVAASNGSLASLHVLVLSGATIDMTDTQLMTPLMVAITKEQNNIVHYLIQAGASLMAKTQDGMTCLHLAAKCGNVTACQHILDSGRLTRHAINTQDEGGWTPLVWASENRFAHVVKFLLDRGGNPQLCDVEQNTALHWAAFSGSTHICSMVLDRGCSLRSMNAHGDTPLHIAARQNHTDAVVLLLARGAQLDIVNTKGQTPIECAVPDSDVYLQLTLNSKVLDMMKQNNIRTEKILSSDIALGKEEVPIPCVNGVDDDPLPKDYLYIAENCEASNVIIDRTITSLKWCECEDGCNTEHCGCGQLNFQCWFDPDGRLLPEFNYADPPMIFECNRACRCNKLSCNNRVVQHGISAHMQLFRTVGKGWGVRALKTIQKGSYVCEYVGEIITDLEADQRQDDSYLFDLDNRDSETFCIDARSYGNIARFINHLCEANLTPVKVFIDHQDLTFPRIALFANRDIEADEELGFDYGEKFWMIKYKHFTCTCLSDKSWNSSGRPEQLG